MNIFESLYAGGPSVGHNRELFIENPPEHLLCPICYDVARDIRVCPSFDGHIFCRSCVVAHLGKAANCPICRSFATFDKMKLAPELDDHVGRLELKCPHSLNYPCAWTGPVVSLSTHLSECLYEEIRCPYLGCSSKFPRCSLETHVEECEKKCNGLRSNNSFPFSHLLKESPKNELEMNFNLLVENDNMLQLKGVQYFRRILSVERNPQIEEVVELGVVPILSYFLNSDTSPTIQFEAAWTLTNIASGASRFTKIVADSGCIPALIRLIASDNDDVAEQSCWALGNVCGDSVVHRDTIIREGAIPAIVDMLQGARGITGGRIAKLRVATWVISNLCRGKPSPPLHIVLPLVAPLVSLARSEDPETKIDVLWALSYIADGPAQNIDVVLNSGIVPDVVSVLGLHSPSVLVTPALRLVGNLVTGNDTQTQRVLDMNLIPSLMQLLNHEKKNIRKETAWALSNITAGTPQQIQSVIDSALFNTLGDTLQRADAAIQRELVWVIGNSATGGTREQIAVIAQPSLLPPFVALLSSSDAKVQDLVLRTIKCFLDAGVGIDEVRSGLSEIERFAKSGDRHLKEKAALILETYFTPKTTVDAI